jgi:hypothetical protein
MSINQFISPLIYQCNQKPSKAASVNPSDGSLERWIEKIHSTHAAGGANAFSMLMMFAG